MIKVVSPTGGFLQAAAGGDLYSAIHFTRYHLYGGNSGGPPRFWQSGSGGLLSLAGDSLTVSGNFSDPEELATFCAVIGARELRGQKEALEPVSSHLGWPVHTRQILSAQDVRPAPIPTGLEEASLREVYPLLVEVFSLPLDQFDPWYCETSYKIRHGLGRVLGIRAEGVLAASAGVYYQNQNAALLASVATLPAFRRRGFASALVYLLASSALEEGRTPFVTCDDPAAIRVYEQAGFSLWGEEWLCRRP